MYECTSQYVAINLCASCLVLKRNDPFVDASEITVHYKKCIGEGSYGVVYKGTYQGTPAAVKIIGIPDNPAAINEFTAPW